MSEANRTAKIVYKSRLTGQLDDDDDDDDYEEDFGYYWENM